MLQWLFQTQNDTLLFLIRIVLGGVILPHGLQKVFGWFGGHGLQGTMKYFTQTLLIPTPFAALAVATEFLGSLLLIFGFGGRIMAAAIAGLMIVAALMVHLRNGFFMNWSSAAPGEGFEYHLLALALAAAIIVRGSGALSIDRLLVR